MATWETTVARPQGPLSSSIPFFYVSGNPFRDILLQHQMVRDRGLHGWVYVNTPPLRHVQELSALTEEERAAGQDSREVPPVPEALPVVSLNEEVIESSDLREEEVTARTVGAHEEIIGKDFFEPVLTEDADDRPNIEIIELTARQEGQEAVVPLLLLEEVEDALAKDESEDIYDQADQFESTTEFIHNSDGPLIEKEVVQVDPAIDNNVLEELEEIESTTVVKIDEAITTTLPTTTKETTTEEATTATATTTTTVATTTTTTTTTTGRSNVELQDPFVPPIGSFEAAVDREQTVEMLMRQPKHRSHVLKLVPSDRDPLLKLRETEMPDNAAVIRDSAVIKGAFPPGALRFIRVGQLAEAADGWEDATGRRRFVGTINAEGPPFFLNFRILPVGHAFDYDLNGDDFQGQQLDATTETAVATTATEDAVKEEEAEISTTAKPADAEETTFNLLREQQEESEEEDEGTAIEIRSLEASVEEEEEKTSSPKRRQQQSFGRRMRPRTRTPRVINNNGAVKARDNGGVVFQPSVLETDSKAKTSQRFT